MRPVALTTLALALTGPVAAHASLSSNTVDPDGTLRTEGRRAAVGVLLSCDRVQSARLRVTLTQRAPASGRAVLAERRRTVRCTSAETRFPVVLTARARRRFEPGDATVCVLARTSDDVRQWCRDVTLEAGS